MGTWLPSSLPWSEGIEAAHPALTGAAHAAMRWKKDSFGWSVVSSFFVLSTNLSVPAAEVRDEVLTR